MAGIADLIKGGNSNALARLTASNRLNEERRTAQAETRGLAAQLDPSIAKGVAAGQLVTQGISALTGGDGAAVDASPEVQQVQANQALMQNIQALSTGDDPLMPGTSEHMAAVGQAAQAAGRTDLALQAAEQSAALKVREDATAVAAAAAQQKESIDAYKALPKAVQLSIAANDPARLVQEQGLSEEQAKIVSADAADTLKTLQDKNRKDLADLKRVHTTSPNSESVKQSTQLLSQMGIGGHTFESGWPLKGKDDPAAFDSFATFMDQQAAKEIDVAAAQQINLTRAEVFESILNELATVEGIEGMGTTDVSGIDMAKLRKIADARNVAATKRTGSTSTRRTVVAQ